MDRPTPVQIEHMRRLRAERFAAQIMTVIGHLIENKQEAFNLLVTEAYKSDVEIVAHNTVGPKD